MRRGAGNAGDGFSAAAEEKRDKGSYQSGQMGQTVNLLAYAFGGSNPSLPTRKRAGWSCKIRTMRGSRASERGRLTLIRYVFAEVAQLIEHQPSKLRVASLSLVFRSKNKCQCSSAVEHFLGKEEVTGSSPVIGSCFEC